MHQDFRASGSEMAAASPSPDHRRRPSNCSDGPC